MELGFAQTTLLKVPFLSFAHFGPFKETGHMGKSNLKKVIIVKKRVKLN